MPRKKAKIERHNVGWLDPWEKRGSYEAKTRKKFADKLKEARKVSKTRAFMVRGEVRSGLRSPHE